jgi:hypothetical protein
MVKISQPAMSVVLPSPGRFQALHGLLRHLRAQGNPEELELVFVVWNRQLHGYQSEGLEVFHSHKVVQMQGWRSRGQIYASGIRAASAPVVALTENHAYPQPGWSEALLKAHEGPWTGVGPVILNGYPDKPVDMACALTLYAPWLQRKSGREMDDLPGSNSSYKRSVLLRYGPELDRLLDNHTLLHWDLRRHGHRLWLEPGARLFHYEYEDLKSLLAENLRVGHRFAANRASSWKAGKRLLFGLGSPLIPFLRLSRILGGLGDCTLARDDIIRALPHTLAGLGAGAWGEMKGYIAGYRNIQDKQAAYELCLEQRILAGKNRLP